MLEADVALITGAHGLLGSALLTELSVKYPSLEILAPTRHELDLTRNLETFDYFCKVKPTVVFHLAARVGGIGGNTSAPAEYFFENILMNSHVVEASRLSGVRKIIAMGTTAVYSSDVALPMQEDDMWIGAPHSSEAAYGHAKRAMLAHLQAAKEQYGVEYAYCILTNCYGKNDMFDERFGHVVPSMISKFIRASLQSETVSLWGDGSPTRDFIYADDAARALIVIEEEVTGSINLASGKIYTVRQLAEEVAAVVGYNGTIEWDASKPNGQMHRAYDLRRLRSTSFSPAHDLRSGLEQTVEWAKRNFEHLRR